MYIFLERIGRLSLKPEEAGLWSSMHGCGVDPASEEAGLWSSMHGWTDVVSCNVV